MTRLPFGRFVLGVLWGIAASAAGAQVGLTPARYFECQIAARQATLVGLEERQELLSKGNITAADRQASEEQARNRVTQAFASCGYSVGALGAYAYRNPDELQSWLNANPAVKAQLDAVGQRVASISEQTPATSPSVKR
jgi:hypothetical protein